MSKHVPQTISEKGVGKWEQGKCKLKGNQKGNAGEIEYDFELERISKTSIVSIPFAN